MPPFKPVERLPVPAEVADSFRKLQNANITRGYSSSGTAAARAKAAEKLANAESEAASHFGGDLGEMMTHFKRWTRWGGRAMGVADFVLPKETIDKTMQGMEDKVVGPAAARLRPLRKKTMA